MHYLKQLIVVADEELKEVQKDEELTKREVQKDEEL